MRKCIRNSGVISGVLFERTAHGMSACAQRGSVKNHICDNQQQEISLSEREASLYVHLAGTLNLDMTRKIEQFCALKERRYKKYQLDFKDVTAIDDDGLSLLIFLPQAAAWEGAEVEFLHCNPGIQDHCKWAAEVSGRVKVLTTTDEYPDVSPRQSAS
jgi:anti-anti-sigma regulatory factor